LRFISSINADRNFVDGLDLQGDIRDGLALMDHWVLD